MEFFCYIHCKGAVGGIGGLVKRRARLAALSGKTVHCVKDFINVQSDQSVIKLFEITETSIDDCYKVLNERRKNVDAIPDTHKMHTIIVTGMNVIKHAPYAKAKNTEWKIHQFKEMNIDLNNLEYDEDLFKVGDWVEVEYSGKRYPGVVKLVGKEDIQVSVLHRQFAQNWKWPVQPDIIF